MLILAIETSCDDTAVAILEVSPQNKVTVLTNVISSQVKLHAPYGGVFPILAAREHAKNIDKVFKLALQEAGLKTIQEIDLMAVTKGPGLVVSLLVGVTFAKTLAWKYKKPLIGVNHLEGHIVSNWLKPVGEISNFQFLISKQFPALCLIVSGGHTSLVLMKDYGQYQLIGETQDDAVGECFDKVARLLGLGYPGGPAISKLAKQGHPDRYPLPSPMLKSKDFNFSYSGLKTAVLYLIRDIVSTSPAVNSGPYPLSAQQKADMAASFQKAAMEVLIQKTVSAAQQLKVTSVLLSGGVSANQYLREELEKRLAKELPKIKFFKPNLSYTTDNAAMIGLAGYLHYRKEKNPPSLRHHVKASEGTAGFSWKSVQANADLGF